jgi:hypothetical protein
MGTYVSLKLSFSLRGRERGDLLSGSTRPVSSDEQIQAGMKAKVRQTGKATGSTDSTRTLRGSAIRVGQQEQSDITN